jgi:hypothetical protein
MLIIAIELLNGGELIVTTFLNRHSTSVGVIRRVIRYVIGG